jgi:peptidoglycan hydrolase-like protein with peptidoglycan-binding domain
MSHPKRLILLGSILLLAGSLFVFVPTSSIAHAASINACPPTQSQGASNTWVQVIQFKLNNYHLGGTPVAVDGVFGPKTKAAVVDLQNAFGISGGGGVVGTRTWSVLDFCPGWNQAGRIYGTGATGTCPPTLSNGSSGVWVQALQDTLNFYYPGVYPDNYPDSFTPYLSSDGSFGAQTYHAVVNFQYALGLSDDGIVGPQTWRDLYMCY